MTDVLRMHVRAILSQLGNGTSFSDSQDVFATSVVTSINLLELICTLEDRWGLTIEQRDVFDGHLRSVDRLVAFVAGRVKEGV